MFTRLGNLAKVSLGYKSLQNDFYYLNRSTIDTFGIEDEFLMPVHMLKELEPSSFGQDPETRTWLFYCRRQEADLRGSGAQRYINAVADRPAKKRKQAAKPQTIREALSAQSGSVWYAPKAQPAKNHIWLRKGIDGVFSPFLFETAQIVDQRCNAVEPLDGGNWEEIAAALTLTVFSFGVEINGATSMGAGVLEASTTKLRDYPVLDISGLDPDQKREMLQLARAVWQAKPVDWSVAKPVVPDALRKLDSWALDIVGSNTSVDRLYEDLKNACHERRGLAKDKSKARKSRRADNVGTVAEGIADRLQPRIHSRHLPEDFTKSEALDTSIHIAPELVYRIESTPFMGQTEVVITKEDGGTILTGSWNEATAETIVRGVLAGRSAFRVPSDRVEASHANDAMIGWLSKLEQDIETAVRTSSLGTGYEEVLRQEIFRRLSVDPALFQLRLPRELVVRLRHA